MMSKPNMGRNIHDLNDDLGHLKDQLKKMSDTREEHRVPGMMRDNSGPLGYNRPKHTMSAEG